jgi:hypothetical protein
MLLEIWKMLPRAKKTPLLIAWQTIFLQRILPLKMNLNINIIIK